MKCNFAGIERPRDSSGKEVKELSLRKSEVEIPLVVGSLRDISNETELVVDVIVNPIVTVESKNDLHFRRQLSHLALESICSETKVIASVDDISHKVEGTIDRMYVGGRGENGTTPVLFPLMLTKDGAVQTLSGNIGHFSNDEKKPLDSPASLLSAKASCNDSVILSDLKFPIENEFVKPGQSAPICNKDKHKASLIEEISRIEDNDASSIIDQVNQLSMFIMIITIS